MPLDNGLLCNEMNEDCAKCGGKGYVEVDDKIEHIKIHHSEDELNKQKLELKEYLKGNDEKMYVSDNKSNLRGKGFFKKLKKKKISRKWIFGK